jgi:hypothetical protein
VAGELGGPGRPACSPGWVSCVPAPTSTHSRRISGPPELGLWTWGGNSGWVETMHPRYERPRHGIIRGNRGTGFGVTTEDGAFPADSYPRRAALLMHLTTDGGAGRARDCPGMSQLAKTDKQTPWEAVEVEAAAHEAAAIGGHAGDEGLDPAQRPLIEAGEGEAEGFELAEADLIRAAESIDSQLDPFANAFSPEADDAPRVSTANPTMSSPPS